MLRLEEDEGSPAAGSALEVSRAAIQEAIERSGQHPQGVCRELRYQREGDLLALKGRQGEIAALEHTALFLLLGDALLLGLLLPLGKLLGNWALRPWQEEKRRQAELAAEISHELKTPLAVILANAGLLLAHPERLGKKGRGRILAIRAEGQRMAGLVADLLAVSRLEAEEPGEERLDFSRLVQGALLSFEAVAFEQGLELKGEIAPGLFLRGDEGRLTQLVEILLDNACKYAPPGTAVEIRLAGRGRGIVLQVKNQGDPIPPEELEKLFRRFYRAAGQDREGAGLGLFLARRIAACYGGKLTARSDRAGTVFTAEFPAGSARDTRRFSD